jgi:hypothetical protein
MIFRISVGDRDRPERIVTMRDALFKADDAADRPGHAGLIGTAAAG